MNKKILVIFSLVVVVIIFILEKNRTDNSAVLSFDKKIKSDEYDISKPVIEKVSEDSNKLVHKVYGFSIEYPSNLKVTNFFEGGGEQIVFSNSAGDWIQIYVSSWDEDSIITPERIKKDLHQIVITEPKQVILGPRQKEGIGPVALVFFSKDASLNDIREVWFAVGGNLYQISTYKRLDSVIGSILSTIIFKE